MGWPSLGQVYPFVQEISDKDSRSFCEQVLFWWLLPYSVRSGLVVALAHIQEEEGITWRGTPGTRGGTGVS